ncbi:DUF6624 domain-containing protein [Streptomyces virginiae]|uniref:DUF6624 domain-containing protein n=1 Tax=Streptomyces virginiae TaxID=1961 RepID=UPI0035E190AD
MNSELAEALNRRAGRDQEARRAAQETGLAGDLLSIDADNTAWLKGIVAEHGWPGVDLVGEEGAEMAWLLAQHADREPQFQQRALELLTAAVEAGQAPRRHPAYLTDRCLVGAGEQQVYGTQYVSGPDGTGLRLHAVADPEGLDARREAVGLEPSAAYDRRMRGQE